MRQWAHLRNMRQWAHLRNMRQWAHLSSSVNMRGWTPNLEMITKVVSILEKSNGIIDGKEG
jgi:hypothetical protein